MLRLSDLKVGDHCLIRSFSNDGIASKLISMGVYPDSLAEVFDSNHNNYAFFIIIGSLKIALLREEAHTLIVEKVDSTYE